MNPISRVICLLAFSLSATEISFASLSEGTIVDHKISRAIDVLSVDGYQVVSQANAPRSSQRFRMELNLTIEGNQCNADNVVMEMAGPKATINWKTHEEQSNETLTLRAVSPAYSDVDGCLATSNPVHVKVAIELTSWVGPPTTSSIQKSITRLQIPLAENAWRENAGPKIYVITHEWNRGWNVVAQ